MKLDYIPEQRKITLKALYMFVAKILVKLNQSRTLAAPVISRETTGVYTNP